VRWLPVAMIGGADGNTVGSAQEAGVTLEGGASIEINVPSVRAYSASLIRQNSIATLAGMTFVIDADAATGVTLDALADYVALVALTGMPMGEAVDDMRQAESILALFASPEGRGIREMTAADRAYLTELYTIPPDRTARWVRGRMNRAVEQGMAEEAQAAEGGEVETSCP
jgi:hypothetical protein